LRVWIVGRVRTAHSLVESGRVSTCAVGLLL